MVETRFPTSGLTTEYGNIVLSSVTEKVSLEITYDSDVILEEDYYPDADGVVQIRDIGKLADMYIQNGALSLTDLEDEGSVLFAIKVTEAATPEVVITKNVTFYYTSVDFAGSISTALLLKMPLSRVTTKTTGPGRKEYVSFYGDGDVLLYAVYSDGTKDVAITLGTYAELSTPGTIYRVDVSPDVVAAEVGCSVLDLVYYNVYKDGTAIIRYKMDDRNFVNKTTFLFRNAFGAQETITFVGHEQREGKWDREYGVIDNAMVQTSRDKTDKIKVRTGYLLPGMADVIDDLLNADQVGVIENGVLYPVVILEEDFSRTSRRNEARSYEITYRYASNNIQAKYTPLVKPGVFDETFDETFN